MDKFVDCNYGIDNINSSIYKTLDFALDDITNLSDNIININLMAGNYNLKLHDSLFKSNKTVNVKGKDGKTILTQTEGFYSNYGGGSINFTLNIYNLIYNTPKTISYNWNYFKFNWNFYNIIFNEIANELYAVMYPLYSTIYMMNCTKSKLSSNFLRTTEGKIYLKNSYGAFTNGWGTTQSKWDDGSNLILNEPNLDSDFKILNGIENSLYGVYSGLYGWKLYKYLLKQNTQYYTIHNDFYSNGKYNNLGDSIDIKDEYAEKYMEDDLKNYFIEKSINNEIFKPIDKFDKFNLILMMK